ncbi:hypothetical protein FRIGORI9N_400124 [Frigoribacterium sp. 9N]|nr:hypothetical protein FRIGORI9N_400124 [Frigoribacterium sp. 9N]
MVLFDQNAMDLIVARTIITAIAERSAVILRISEDLKKRLLCLFHSPFHLHELSDLRDYRRDESEAHQHRRYGIVLRGIPDPGSAAPKRIEEIHLGHASSGTRHDLLHHPSGEKRVTQHSEGVRVPVCIHDDQAVRVPLVALARFVESEVAGLAYLGGVPLRGEQLRVEVAQHGAAFFSAKGDRKSRGSH